MILSPQCAESSGVWSAGRLCILEHRRSLRGDQGSPSLIPHTVPSASPLYISNLLTSEFCLLGFVISLGLASQCRCLLEPWVVRSLWGAACAGCCCSIWRRCWQGSEPCPAGCNLDMRWDTYLQ